MPRYTVEEYDGGVSTGRKWDDIEAPDAIQAAMQALDRSLIDQGTPGRLTAKVWRIGGNFKPEIIWLYEPPQVL